MNNTRNGYSSSVPNQPDRYDSGTRSSGWRFPPLASRNSWSRSDSMVNRRLLGDPPTAYSRTSVSSTIDSVPSSHTPHQIPIRTSNNERRQHLEALRQAVHFQSQARPDSNSRSASQQQQQAIGEEEEILKHLTKETYNPLPKSLLLRNLSLYYRNKTPGTGNENSINSRNFSPEEDDKNCTVCLEDFKPKETMMVTPCKHIFHEECIVPWLKTKGQCPVCRFVILKPTKRDSSPTSSSNLTGDMTVHDLFTLELLSVVRAMEESFLYGHPRYM